MCTEVKEIKQAQNPLVNKPSRMVNSKEDKTKQKQQTNKNHVI